jgi:hypothetical protein
VSAEFPGTLDGTRQASATAASSVARLGITGAADRAAAAVGCLGRWIVENDHREGAPIRLRVLYSRSTSEMEVVVSGPGTVLPVLDHWDRLRVQLAELPDLHSDCGAVQIARRQVRTVFRVPAPEFTLHYSWCVPADSHHPADTLEPFGTKEEAELAAAWARARLAGSPAARQLVLSRLTLQTADQPRASWRVLYPEQVR